MEESGDDVVERYVPRADAEAQGHGGHEDESDPAEPEEQPSRSSSCLAGSHWFRSVFAGQPRSGRHRNTRFHA
ncbi:hypothetical protein GCM10010431_21620 [Streptomyces kunmingensis]